MNFFYLFLSDNFPRTERDNMRIDVKRAAGLLDVCNGLTGLDGNELVNVYYDANSNALAISPTTNAEMGVWLTVLKKPFASQEDCLHFLIAMADVLDNTPEDANPEQYNRDAVLKMYLDMGMKEDRFDDFAMMCYLWKTYTLHHLEADDGKEAVLYIGMDGNAFCHDNVAAPDIWYRDAIRRGPVTVGEDGNIEARKSFFFAVHPDQSLAKEPVERIAIEALRLFRKKQKAIRLMRRQF